jgi:hypothetical protein
VGYVQQAYQVIFDGPWSLEKKSIAAQAIMAVGAKLMTSSGSESAAAAFVRTYQPLTFRYVEGVCGSSNENTCGADAFLGPGTVRFWSHSWSKAFELNGLVQVRRIENEFRRTVVVHELGHILDQLSGRLMTNALSSAGVRTREGMTLQESKYDDPYEIGADYFLNWVYDGFSSIEVAGALDESWPLIVDIASNWNPH